MTPTLGIRHSVNLKASRRLLLLECQSSIFVLGCLISLVWFYFFIFVATLYRQVSL